MEFRDKDIIYLLLYQQTHVYIVQNILQMLLHVLGSAPSSESLYIVFAEVIKC